MSKVLGRMWRGSSQDDMVERLCQRRKWLLLRATGGYCCHCLSVPLSVLASCKLPYLLLGWRRLIASVHGCISARCCIHHQPSSSSPLNPTPPLSVPPVLSSLCREADKQFLPIFPHLFPSLSFHLLLSWQYSDEVRLLCSFTVKGPGNLGDDGER